LARVGEGRPEETARPALSRYSRMNWNLVWE
jgi:hypothetical protein